MTFINEIFDTISYIIADFGALFENLFANITSIFFVTNAESVVTITPVGILTLCTFGIGLIWTGIRWLSRLIKLRG